MVTIKDIARESGYSVSTVSRVLNNRNDVSPDARKKIEEVVAKFNFVPNNNAKHLKQNNSKAIGVLVKGISNMLFASVVEEIQRMIEKTEYTLVVSYLDEDADEVEQAILLCRERKPLGLLFLGGNPEYFHREFSGVDVPCVLVTNRANEMHFENLSSVATDDIAAARCAVDQLFVAGHRRIGILGGDFDKSYTSHQRFLGCEQSFSEHGAVLDVEHCYEKARFSFGSACRAMKRLIGKFPDVTAVFAMSDVMAIGAIRALRDLGYRVPEDVSVMGFDDILFSQAWRPSITTMAVSKAEFGKKAFELLYTNIQQGTTGYYLNQLELIQRASTAPPGR